MNYIIDLDGTILNGTNANKDSVSFVKKLQANNSNFLIMTNSIKSPTVVVERLNDVGLDVSLEHVMNPISTINTFIEEHDYKKVYTVGSLKEIEQVNAVQELVDPELIVLLDFEKENFTYNILQSIFELLESGVPIISASGSVYYLSKDKKVLDTGSFVKLFESVTGTDIEIFGKPSRRYFESGVKKLNALPKDVTVIGDDHSTDIKGAMTVGCKGILIQSGKYKTGDELINVPTQCISDFSEIVLGD
jgi:HAD superfamily hydrolase (TIGR01450 family)